MFQVIEISTGLSKTTSCSLALAGRMFQALWAAGRPALLIGSPGAFAQALKETTR